MIDIKPAAWTSKKGLRHLARTGFLSVGKNEDRERNMPLYGHEATDEITRLRQLLSEAEKREAEARATALEEAAKIAEAERMRHSTGSGFDSHPSHTTAFRIREAIRALQSEER